MSRWRAAHYLGEVCIVGAEPDHMNVIGDIAGVPLPIHRRTSRKKCRCCLHNDAVPSGLNYMDSRGNSDAARSNISKTLSRFGAAPTTRRVMIIPAVVGGD